MVRYCKESDPFSRKLVFEYLIFEYLPNETFFEHLYGKTGSLGASMCMMPLD
jgi:hypothetical protein